MNDITSTLLFQCGNSLNEHKASIPQFVNGAITLHSTDVLLTISDLQSEQPPVGRGEVLLGRRHSHILHFLYLEYHSTFDLSIH